MTATSRRSTSDVALLHVRVTPKSSKDAVIGVRDGELHVRVRAVPEDGKANSAVCVVVAKALHVPKSSIDVIRGGASRNKTLDVSSMTDSELAEALGAMEQA